MKYQSILLFLALLAIFARDAACEKNGNARFDRYANTLHPQ